MKAFRFSLKPLITLSVLVFSFFVNTTFAGPLILYGTLGNGISGGPDTLVIIDQGTGAIQQTIGNIGYVVNGLAIDPTTGILYGSTSNLDSTSPNSLITIDTTTGAGTLIAPFTPTPPPPPNKWSINCITFDLSGQMYGWKEPDPNRDDDLVRIDKTTAVYVQLQNSLTLQTQAVSLDFNNADVLYLLSGNTFSFPPSIYTINPLTGAATFVTNFTPSPQAHHGKFHPVTQQMWTINQTFSTNPRFIHIYDIPSGLLVNSLPTDNQLHTIAFTVPVDPVIQLYKLLGKKRLIYQKGLFP